MGLFWKRKSGDQFVSLKLNEPLTKQETAQPKAAPPAAPTIPLPERELEPVATGSGPTPVPAESAAAEKPKPAPPPMTEQSARIEAQQKPVPSRSPFATSVLGLNLSMEELQAQEAAR